jgi:hypothetical protein
MIALKWYHEKGGYNGGHLVVSEINRADRSILLSAFAEDHVLVEDPVVLCGAPFLDLDKRSFFWNRTLKNFKRYVNPN